MKRSANTFWTKVVNNILLLFFSFIKNIWKFFPEYFDIFWISNLFLSEYLESSFWYLFHIKDLFFKILLEWISWEYKWAEFNSVITKEEPISTHGYLEMIFLKIFSIGTFVFNNRSTIYIFSIINYKRTSFPTWKVFSWVKTKRLKISKSSK